MIIHVYETAFVSDLDGDMDDAIKVWLNRLNWLNSAGARKWMASTKT